MPHMPRSLSSTSGVRPELTTQPRNLRSMGGPAPSPYHGSTQGEEPLSNYHKPPQQRMQERLSVQKHEVDPNRVWKQLMGKEANVDEHTRELVQS
jgi:hypothetical protein